MWTNILAHRSTSHPTGGKAKKYTKIDKKLILTQVNQPQLKKDAKLTKTKHKLLQYANI